MARGGDFVVFSGAVILAVFGFGSCLRCYQCDTVSDKGCMIILKGDKERQVDCGNNKTAPSHVQGVPIGKLACAKIETKNGHVTRSCAVNMEIAACKVLSLMHPKVKNCGVCTSDLCNNSNSVTAWIPIGFLALISSYLF